jgi:hypothetical protein
MRFALIFIAGCGSTPLLPPQGNEPPIGLVLQCQHQETLDAAPQVQIEAGTCDRAFAETNESGADVGTYQPPDWQQ